MTRFFLNSALSLLAASTLAAQAAPAKSASPTQAKPKQEQALATKPAPAAATTAPMQAPAKTAKVAPARRADATTVTADQIKQAQQALTDKGLYKGKVTGRLNRDFRKAVKDFQTQNQLKPTGRLNQETLAKLNVH